MKFLLIPLFILSINLTFAQTINFNKYQYVIVDSKFDFVRQVDGYRTSSLTKFLFKKKDLSPILIMRNTQMNSQKMDVRRFMPR